jgi:hypothetical protein
MLDDYSLLYISGFLRDYRRDYERDPTLPVLVKSRPFFRRALFTVGLLLRHFDFTDKDVIQGLEVSLHLLYCRTCNLVLLTLLKMPACLMDFRQVILKHYFYLTHITLVLNFEVHLTNYPSMEETEKIGYNQFSSSLSNLYQNTTFNRTDI